MGEPRIHDPLSADWVVLVLLAVLVQLAWTNVMSPRKWGLLLNGAFGARISRRSLREDIDLQDRSMLGLLAALMAGLGLFLHQVLVIRGIADAGPGGYVIVVALLLVMVLAQVFLLRALGWLFQGDGGLQEYTYTWVIDHLVLGAALLPVAVLVAYRPEMRSVLLPMGGVIASVIVLLRWGRAGLIGRSAGVPFRHIFLYLCAAEILPVFLVLQTLQRSGPSAFQLH